MQRSVIVLEEKRIPYTRIDIDLANKPDWFEQCSPMGKVPLLLVDEKPALFESAIICEYLDEITAASLHPMDSFDKALHRAWIEFGTSILGKIANLYNAKSKSDFDVIHIEIQEKFGAIESAIAGFPYFTGGAFHLIDAVYGPIFRYFDVFDSFIDLQTFKSLPKCNQWRSALANRDSVKSAVSVDYPAQLTTFLLRRVSHMSRLLSQENF
ncbi:glutathione S-transferase family protein [Motilimonas sp. 1_MG-2023]|uniref:glutathione S-transferase family protein n=1 Tax=Motilimonas sp. 1_MG-2023 TaxID=3062672 RepID=UPI0026E35717|nr:glutathione S-transferase family protein [Motilimonas sp. 1_MG-2023]MDO6527149.1 glutathione S-transferase family protein [Motilimonas sp. 1_MG-2023]